MFGARSLFPTESLVYPGFIEFDGKANKAITFSAPDEVYRVWDLDSCHYLFSIASKNVLEVKMSSNKLVVFSQVDSTCSILCSIYDIECGTLLCTSRLRMLPRSGLSLINHEQITILYTETIGDLLFAFASFPDVQSGFLRTVNLRTSSSREQHTEGMDSVASFMFLHSIHRVVAFSRKGKALLFNENLQLVATIPRSLVCCDFENVTCTAITEDERLLVSVVESSTGEVCFNMIHPLTGRLLRSYNMGDELRRRGISMSVTSIMFDNNSDSRLLVTGHRDNSVCFWQV
ncbi:hypothetical protein RCL1_007635 [Eukaryota sp. TZLM3-RCL]